jgi:hypothetical protein
MDLLKVIDNPQGVVVGSACFGTIDIAQIIGCLYRDLLARHLNSQAMERK